MVAFDVHASGKLEIPSLDEIRRGMRDEIVGWVAELGRGVKFHIAGGQAAKIGAVFTLDKSTKSGQMGPAAGFVWSVLNVAVAGAAYKFGTDTFSVFLNESSNLRVIATGVSRQTSFNPGQIVLNPNDSLIVSGAATDPGTEIGVTLMVAEVPVQLAWQLL